MTQMLTDNELDAIAERNNAVPDVGDEIHLHGLVDPYADDHVSREVIGYVIRVLGTERFGLSVVTVDGSTHYLNDYKSHARTTVHEDIETLVSEVRYLRQQLQSAGTDWAVQEQSITDGPWGRIDDGSGWSNRFGAPYTEAEARKLVAQRQWRRLVKRVAAGPWTAADQ